VAFKPPPKGVTVELPYQSLVHHADPDFEYGDRHQLFYEFANGRKFLEDENQHGAYLSSGPASVTLNGVGATGNTGLLLRMEPHLVGVRATGSVSHVVGIGSEDDLPLSGIAATGGAGAITTTARSEFFALGINLSGMEDGSGAPSLAEMSYFVNRGIKVFRLPLSWTSIQSTASGALDGTAYLATLSSIMANAASIGAKIIPDIHTFGVGPGGVKIGSAGLPVTAFVDFWTKFSAWLRADPNYAAIAAYDPMNEWNGMDPNSVLPSTTYSQNLILSANSGVMTALRGAGDNTKLLLEWDHFSGAWDAVTNNIHLLFTLILSDPAQNSKASLHCYLDNDSSGSNFVWANEIAKPGLAPPGTPTSVNIFSERLASVVALAQAMGIPLHVGEMGWSSDALTLGGNDDYADWNQAADNALAYCVANAIEITPWAAGPGFTLSYGYNPEPSNVASPGTKDFTTAGLQSTQMVILEKYSGYTGAQPAAYRADDPFNAVPYAVSGTPIPNFKIRYNAKIASTISFTGTDSLPDGTAAGGAFSSLSMAPGNNGIVTFSYTPSGTHKQISLTFTNSDGLINPPAIGCSSSLDRFTTSSISPNNVYGLRLLYNVYIGPAIRLQRSSDSAQMDFYFNNNGDLPRQAIQDWAVSDNISIVTIYDQSLNGQNIAYRAGAHATLNLVNSAGYPEVVFPAGAEYGFSSAVGGTTSGNTQQTIIARVSDGNSGAFFISQDNSNGPSSFFPFRFAPSGYNINNSSAAVTLADQVSVYHTYGGTFTANTTNGLVGYKDGSVTTQANTPAGGLLSNSPSTSMGYFAFFPSSQWTGRWTNLIILTTAINATVMAEFASDDSAYYSTPLPDTLTPNIGPPGAMTLATAPGSADVSTVLASGPTGATSTVWQYARAGSGAWITAATTTTSTLTFDFTGLTPNTSYDFQAYGIVGGVIGAASKLLAQRTAGAGPGPGPTISDFGVNLSGPENSSPVFTSNAQMDYWINTVGCNLIRLPTRWENWTPTLGQPALDPSYAAAIDAQVAYITGKGCACAIDIHNYGQFFMPGSPGHDVAIGAAGGPTQAQFAAFWALIATRYMSNPLVRFDLMNEPTSSFGSTWLTIGNAAVAAIRGTGATNLIYFPILAGDAGEYKSANYATGIVDSGNNYQIECHQYFNVANGQFLNGRYDGSTGDTGNDFVASSTITISKLKRITLWARRYGQKLYLGEFEAGQTTANVQALGYMYDYMQANADVWQGLTHFYAGQFTFPYAADNPPSHTNASWSIMPVDGTGAVNFVTVVTEAPQITAMREYMIGGSKRGQAATPVLMTESGINSGTCTFGGAPIFSGFGASCTGNGGINGGEISSFSWDEDDLDSVSGEVNVNLNLLGNAQVFVSTGAVTFVVNTNGSLRLTYGTGGTAVTVTSAAGVFTYGSPHNIAYSVGPSGGFMFVDGLLVGSSATSYAAAGGGYTGGIVTAIGGYYQPISGTFSQAAIFSGVQRHTASYTPSSAPLTGTEQSLLFFWPLNSNQNCYL
jgi:aryl-phospho-beta-D-glucosidase BglC (GH1 family)